MDRDRLERYLAEGLSLSEIGILENRDASTVGYWVEKYGLVANGKTKHAARGAVDPDRLTELVKNGLTLKAIAAELDRSQSTIRHWIKRLGLRSPKSYRDEARNNALAEGRKAFVAECKWHGNTIFVIENSGRVRCRKCRMGAVSAWRRRSKEKLVVEAGGECIRCGYRRCLAAIQLHHRDRRKKEFHLSNSGVPRSIEALRAEARKCDLLCANCHAEVEIGFEPE
jgi:hypothetical protein